MKYRLDEDFLMLSFRRDLFGRMRMRWVLRDELSSEDIYGRRDFWAAWAELCECSIIVVCQ